MDHKSCEGFPDTSSCAETPKISENDTLSSDYDESTADTPPKDSAKRASTPKRYPRVLPAVRKIPKRHPIPEKNGLSPSGKWVDPSRFPFLRILFDRWIMFKVAILLIGTCTLLKAFSPSRSVLPSPVCYSTCWLLRTPLLSFLKTPLCGLNCLQSFVYLNSEKELLEEYDFVVVGSGPGGAVAASRLSRLGNNAKVLLLESGGYPNFSTLSIQMIPYLVPLNQRTNYDWKFSASTLEGTGKGLNDGVNFWPRGRIIGGSGVLNYMLYVRGNKHDYDSWEAAGAEGWSYEDVLPYFKKIEDVGDIITPNYTYRGRDGPIRVGKRKVLHKLTRIFISAAQEIGYPYNNDYNSGDGFGVSQYQYNIFKGERWNHIRGYLFDDNPVGRENLHILPFSHVVKLNFDKKKRISDVEFVMLNAAGNLRDGTHTRIKVAKEVIVSGGSVLSPHLLMLSGIGPRAHLEDKGIEVIAELPGVGQNLQDHVMVPRIYRTRKNIFTDTLINVLSLSNLFTYFTQGEGPISSPGCEGQLITENFESMITYEKDFKDENASDGLLSERTMIDDISTKFSNLLPDIQMIFAPGSLPPSLLQKFWNIRNDVISNSNTKYPGAMIPLFERGSPVSIIPILLHPHSRGSIQLASSNPFILPIIEANYLASDRDQKALAKGIQIANDIMQSMSFKAYIDDPYGLTCDVPAPSPGGFIDEACSLLKEGRLVEAYVAISKGLPLTLYHPVGTCRMGKPRLSPEKKRFFSEKKSSFQGSLPYRSFKRFASKSSTCIVDAKAALFVHEATSHYDLHEASVSKIWHDRFVVDEKLRVCGGECVSGVRIVDSSVMPHLPSGNTYVPTMMIAERAVDFISEEYYGKH